MSNLQSFWKDYEVIETLVSLLKYFMNAVYSYLACKEQFILLPASIFGRWRVSFRLCLDDQVLFFCIHRGLYTAHRSFLNLPTFESPRLHFCKTSKDEKQHWCEIRWWLCKRRITICMCSKIDFFSH